MTVVDHIDLDDDDIVAKVDYVDLTSEEEDNVEKEDHDAAQSEYADETEQGATAATSLSTAEQEKGSRTTSLSMAEQEKCEQHGHETAALLSSPLISSASPFSREFRKAGDCKIAAQHANNSASKLDVYGFNVYHKNPLILPFWSAGSETDHHRGIAGVLEASFIRPRHDNQDFEKTGLIQRLEARLKDVTREDWIHHNGRLTDCTQRATTKTRARSSRVKASVGLGLISSGENSRDPLHLLSSTCSSTQINTTQQNAPCKRRNPFSVNEQRDRERKNIIDHANQNGGVNVIETGDGRSRILISHNQMLKAECSELDAAGQELQFKANILRKELHEWQLVGKILTDELEEVYHRLSPLSKDELEGVYERPSPS